MKELAECRREGLALDLGEIKRGLNTVAAPVRGANGTPIGYIVVLGLFSVEKVSKFGPKLAKEAKALSRQLGVKWIKQGPLDVVSYNEECDISLRRRYKILK
jgi:DNA-binding IclR family transcriptional regulator